MNPLDQLADIHLPPPIGIWPIAWGWWLVLIVSLAFIAGLIYWLKEKIKIKIYRKAALQELALLQTDQEMSPQLFVQSANRILHRCALHHPNKNTQLTGHNWLMWLDEQCKPAGTQFSTGVGRLLLNGPYQANFTLSEQDQQALHKLVVLWIKKHQFVATHLEQHANV